MSFGGIRSTMGEMDTKRRMGHGAFSLFQIALPCTTSRHNFKPYGCMQILLPYGTAVYSSTSMADDAHQ